jgi:hypothetical protein
MARMLLSSPMPMCSTVTSTPKTLVTNGTLSEVPRTFRAANPLTLTRKGAAPQTAVLAVASFERTSISGAFGSCG